MTASSSTINSNQSDVLIRAKNSIVAYLASTLNQFEGSIAIKNDELEDASVEFLIDPKMIEQKHQSYPQVSFKSISFQKINSNINFLKGYLTINNVTKIVELEAVLTQLETRNNNTKALFEVAGKVNRKDFNLPSTAFHESNVIAMGNEINLIANLEFSTFNN